LKNLHEIGLIELSISECVECNGGLSEPGDALYYFMFGLSYIVTTCRNAAASSNASLMEAGKNNPVGTFN
jgi:hypothetical protein